jgi:periplasmic protein TonB
MASPEELIPSLPDTLPEDFGEWDSEGSATATAVAPGEWESAQPLNEAPEAFSQSADNDAPAVAEQREAVSNGKSEAVPTAKTLSSREEWEAWIESHSFSEAPKPFGKTAQRDEAPASPVDKQRGSSTSAPEIAKKQKDSSNGNGKPSPASKPAQSGEWENWVAAHSNGKTPKSNGRSAEPKATASPAAEKPRFSGSASSAAVLDAEPESTSKPAVRPSRAASSNPVLSSPAPNSAASSSLVSLGLGVSRATNAVPLAAGMTAVVEADEIVHSSEPTATLRREADEALSKLYSPKETEVEEEPKTINKKWMIVGGVGAGAILISLILMMTVFHHGKTPAARPSVETVPTQTDTQVETPAPDPSANVPATLSAPAAANAKQPAASNQNSQPSAADSSVKSPKTPTKSQAKMMGDQLNAPTQIEKQAAEVAPPPVSFDVAGVDGLGGSGANANPLNGHAQPVVKFVPPKPIAVSSGVATGLLIQRTPPVYPSIAKAARVGGTVELHATISKNGTIKDVHVVSGPAMLQQAAVEAVRNWRYRPYMLNNEPIEVETSVSVVFSLDK